MGDDAVGAEESSAGALRQLLAGALADIQQSVGHRAGPGSKAQDDQLVRGLGSLAELDARLGVADAVIAPRDVFSRERHPGHLLVNHALQSIALSPLLSERVQYELIEHWAVAASGKGNTYPLPRIARWSAAPLIHEMARFNPGNERLEHLVTTLDNHNHPVVTALSRYVRKRFGSTPHH